jgi:hypothetical protein
MGALVKDLFIYHPGTGTMISLNDEVYLCKAQDIDVDFLYAIEKGARVSIQNHKGYRLDNFNMNNLFFGDS